MKVNLDSVSTRAQRLISHPQFMKVGLVSAYEISLDESDKILTVFYSATLPIDLRLMSETLAFFSKGRSISDLWKLEFREAENFLRDENHKSAFSEAQGEWQNSWEKGKMRLLSSLYKEKLGQSYVKLLQQYADWKELSLVARNQWAQELLHVLGWQLVLCDEHTLTVAGVPSGVNDSLLNELLRGIFGDERSDLPMKVVAVQ